MSRLGQQISAARQRKGVSAKALAKQCGVSERFLIEVEAGRRIVPDALGARMLKALGMSADNLNLSAQAERELERAEVAAARGAPRPQKPQRPKAAPDEPPDASWQMAFSNIMHPVPVYMAAGERTTRLMPVIEGRIEGFVPDKVFYVQMTDDSMSALRIRKGDMLFIAPQSADYKAAVLYLEIGAQRVLRRVEKLDARRLLVQSFGDAAHSDTLEAAQVSVLGRLVRVEFTV